MFSKNNLKYILILALGFAWCSSLYLTQEQYLVGYANPNFINIVELLFGSISMALGILLFGLLYKKNRNVSLIYTIFMIFSIALMLVFFLTKNLYIMSICLCLSCFFGTAGFGAGYHFSLLGLNVDRNYRGRVFAIGYGIGSIITYLLILLPNEFYSSINTLFIYIPLVLINLFVVLKYTKLEKLKKENNNNKMGSLIFKLSIRVLVMALLSALSTDAIAINTITIYGGYGATRIYYCLGLLLAGFLVDKKNNLFEIVIIASFVFSLLGIILLKDNYSINIIAALSYFSVAFFVLFRTMIFVNLVDSSRSLAWLSAFGLMYSRIMEGLMVLFEDSLIENYSLLLIIISILLVIVIIMYFLVYFNNTSKTPDDKIKQVAIKYGLSNQEEKVLGLLVSGKGNQEMADSLYISIFTVKRHIANIYTKTRMKKKELMKVCFK